MMKCNMFDKLRGIQLELKYCRKFYDILFVFDFFPLSYSFFDLFFICFLR